MSDACDTVTHDVAVNQLWAYDMWQSLNESEAKFMCNRMLAVSRFVNAVFVSLVAQR